MYLLVLCITTCDDVNALKVRPRVTSSRPREKDRSQVRPAMYWFALQPFPVPAPAGGIGAAPGPPDPALLADAWKVPLTAFPGLAQPTG